MEPRQYKVMGVNDRESPPMEDRELFDHAREGHILPNTLVYDCQTDEWLHAWDIPPIQSILRPMVQSGRIKMPLPQAPEPVSTPPVQPVATVQSSNGKKSSALADLGQRLLIIGIIMATYFLLFFNTTVEVPEQTIDGEKIGGGRVVNIVLIADRQAGITIASGVAIIGGIFVALGWKNE